MKWNANEETMKKTLWKFWRCNDTCEEIYEDIPAKANDNGNVMDVW